MLSKTEILAVFSVKSPVIPNENKLFHLNVMIDPVSNIVEDAEVCNANLAAVHYVQTGD
jgi:hypothetical protein